MNIWFMPSSQTILEEICEYSKTRSFWIPSEPYMLLKENELEVCIIILYVDDMLIIGKKEQSVHLFACSSDARSG